MEVLPPLCRYFTGYLFIDQTGSKSVYHGILTGVELKNVRSILDKGVISIWVTHGTLLCLGAGVLLRYMNTKLCGVVSVLLFVLFIPFTTFAVSPQVTSNTTTIAELMQQIAVLQVQIEELKADLANTKQELAVVKEEIRITKTLRRGMEDEEVKKLQEFLSTMPDVYPEGLITGYFGFLTEKAVKKFQEKNASDVLKPLGLSKGTGFVGMKTMEKMNDVLDESGVLSNAASTNEEKVTICHFPPENPINKQTIAIGVSALPAHKTHGDTVGACNNEQVSPIQNPSPTSTACTTDAKMCSDGSS